MPPMSLRRTLSRSLFSSRVSSAPLRQVLVLVLAAVLLVGVSGCGSAEAESQEQASAPKTVTVTETATATPKPEPAEDPAEDAGDSQVGDDAAPAGGGSFAMPNEVGKALQAAQDDLQALSGNPFFYSDSADTSGQGRVQVLDSGWKVCKQNKRPGAQISEDDQSIVFGVVRVEERCP